MAFDIRWLGQSCFEITAGDKNILVDPFLNGNPKAAAAADEMEPDVILLTHGHADHLGDTVDIAKRTGATVVAIVELAAEIGEDGVENVIDPNYGGTVSFDWGWVKLVPAWHTAVSPKGTPHMPAGLLIHIGDRLTEDVRGPLFAGCRGVIMVNTRNERIPEDLLNDSRVAIVGDLRDAPAAIGGLFN